MAGETGGGHDVDIEHIVVGLVTRVEVEQGGGDHDAVGEFHRVNVSGPLRLAEGQRLSLPFQIVMPWETPITDVYGQHLHGMTMGVRTEVAIALAVDKSDLDLVAVHPLPVQQRILEAFARLGFTFKNADLEHGQITGVPQSLPFYQEIEFFPAPQYAHAVTEVELTFITTPHTVEVILEFDNRGGMFTGGHDTFSRYQVAHTDADSLDWAQQVDGWVRHAIDQRPGVPGGYGAPAGYPMGGYPTGHAPAYGVPHNPHAAYGHGDHHDDHRSGGGSGMGGVLLGAAGGLAAGYVASEIIDEVFEDDEGDE